MEQIKNIHRTSCIFDHAAFLPFKPDFGVETTVSDRWVLSHMGLPSLIQWPVGWCICIFTPCPDQYGLTPLTLPAAVFSLATGIVRDQAPRVRGQSPDVPPTTDSHPAACIITPGHCVVFRAELPCKTLASTPPLAGHWSAQTNTLGIVQSWTKPLTSSRETAVLD